MLPISSLLFALVMYSMYGFIELQVARGFRGPLRMPRSSPQSNSSLAKYRGRTARVIYYLGKMAVGPCGPPRTPNSTMRWHVGTSSLLLALVLVVGHVWGLDLLQVNATSPNRVVTTGDWISTPNGVQTTSSGSILVFYRGASLAFSIYMNLFVL